MIRQLSLAAILAFAAAIPPAQAQSSGGIALADSFRIGTSGALCTAQNRSADPALISMFDRAHAIVCRDSAATVGKLFQLRIRKDGGAAQLQASRDPAVQCAAPAPAVISGLSGVMRADCQGKDGLRYLAYTATRGAELYAAEGLAGYDSALQLGLKSIMMDRPAAGAVEVAVTEAGDPAAFAKVQAGALDPEQARIEGYARNNAGNYAESAAFFETLILQSGADDKGFARSAEYLANQALQQSNLGNAAEADALFQRAQRAADPSDPLIIRLFRNFRAMQALNQSQPQLALARLAVKMPALGESEMAQSRLTTGYIDRPIAQRLNADSEEIARLGGLSQQLTLEERLQILDLQALYLQGAALRQMGKDDEARAALTQAVTKLGAMREGRISSITWLRSASLTELSALVEAQGKMGQARTYLDEAVRLVGIDYPSSAALLLARARLAAFMIRDGKGNEARTLYRQVVAETATTPGAGASAKTVIGPYLALLAGSDASDTAAASDFFAASQILTRPGVAQTQAVLARELSGGSDDASRLFRQSVTLSRDVIRNESEIARLQAKTDPSGDDAALLAAAQSALVTAQVQQTAIVAQLSAFPRYRALGNSQLTLADLQKSLRAGEGYYKLVLSGGKPFALFVTNDTARVKALGISETDLNVMVALLRDSIVHDNNGHTETPPFDIKTAHDLYNDLFGPIKADLKAVTHLIFEPDGAMLQLPVNLLVTDQASVDRFVERTRDPDADPFDMRGTAWLGRDRIVSTSVSPRAFADVRAIAPAKGKHIYLGLGENAPATLTKASSSAIAARGPCDWPLFNWGNPISSAELKLGANALGQSESEVLTGSAFSDTALRARNDLADFRVLHFATHGLVTAPRPSCPAQPSLVTSFGDRNSDGLLTFKEIFDLRLDADTIILSACDTAGMATIAATREAGIATGGNFALDGLVRAFVGAGGRSIIASHWPVPDDFDATKTLISNLFVDPGTIGTGEALLRGQRTLMDRVETSHPYYWAAFAIIGDATKPLTTR